MTDQFAQPYQRIVQDVLDQIRLGRLKAGDKLPSTRELAAHYDVAPGTVQRALSELRGSKAIYSQQGLGSFVRQPEADAAPAPASFEALAKQLAELTSRVEMLERRESQRN
ncbi:GntR family transcriptional regulator [Streptomyces sp. NRRL WC-3742]|uniref:GntR family transcriptional regulator n=1 Tax=Streptomyces sp. NRRL WC-3742 TaxID=1463934 RepID=UPI00131DEBE8|nr:GntR family transcriptional regulator [Streptomyces sp. NRRL WC-3742]